MICLFSIWQRSESVSAHQSKHRITCSASFTNPRRRRRDDPSYPHIHYRISIISVIFPFFLFSISIASQQKSVKALLVRYHVYQCAIQGIEVDVNYDISYRICTHFTMLGGPFIYV